MKNRFNSLLEYLRVERAALEYGLSDLRSSSERRYGGIHNIEKANEKETCLIHVNGNHKTSDCKSYLAMNVSERYDLLKSNIACFSCLLPNHRLDQCSRKKECGNGCLKYHHHTLHGDVVDGSTNALTGNWRTIDEIAVILPIMKVKT